MISARLQNGSEVDLNLWLSSWSESKPGDEKTKQINTKTNQTTTNKRTQTKQNTYVSTEVPLPMIDTFIIVLSPSPFTLLTTKQKTQDG